MLIISLFIYRNHSSNLCPVWKSGRNNTVAQGFERTSEANLTNLIDNLSVTASFFEFETFNNFSTSSEITTKILREKPLSEQDLEFTSDLILKILG